MEAIWVGRGYLLRKRPDIEFQHVQKRGPAKHVSEGNIMVLATLFFFLSGSFKKLSSEGNGETFCTLSGGKGFG